MLWLRRDFLFRKFQQNYKEIKYPPASVEKETNRVSNYLNLIGRSRLAKIFQSCYPDTLNRSIALLPDGTSFIITGDIPLMWLRDSAAQIHHYLPLVMNDPQLQVIFEGLFLFFTTFLFSFFSSLLFFYLLIFYYLFVIFNYLFILF